MSYYLNYNSKILRSGKALISQDNRSFRYGDGLFETMKLKDGGIQLEDFHFERLFKGMKLLQFEPPAYFSPAYLSRQVKELCKQNQHTDIARVRLMIFRGNGGLYDVENHSPNFLIQTWKLPETNQQFNENGLVIDIYPDARKSTDIFANCKTNNYLPYIMAALFATEKKLNDAIILNTYGRICDATIANIFIVKGQQIFTPALTEGCVEGVMRRWLIAALKTSSFDITETVIEPTVLLDADAVFLTNSVQGIRWVQSCGGKTYSSDIPRQIFNEFIHP